MKRNLLPLANHIFISYSRQNQDYVRQLEDELRRRGFDPWVDARIDFGDRWWRTIVQQIRSCAAFVVVMTPEAEESHWVEKEVMLALEEGKPIFPLLLRGQRFPILIDRQYVSVSGGRLPPRRFYERLGRALGVSGVPEPEPHRNLMNMIDDHFIRWREAKYPSRGQSLIGYEEFLEINKLREELRDLDEWKLAFLLRNAVQNGMGGDWGYWLVRNKGNEKIIMPLIGALDYSAGWQPAWRSAYILEVTFGDSAKEVFEELPDGVKSDRDVEFAFQVMITTGVKKHVESIARSERGDLKVKARRVLQEIEHFSESIGEYSQYAPSILEKFKQSMLTGTGDVD